MTTQRLGNVGVADIVPGEEENSDPRRLIAYVPTYGDFSQSISPGNMTAERKYARHHTIHVVQTTSDVRDTESPRSSRVAMARRRETLHHVRLPSSPFLKVKDLNWFS